MKPVQSAHITIQKITGVQRTEIEDQVAVEEPLQIELAFSTTTGKLEKNIAVTMRTPGNDEELAAGFLFTEGIIQNKESILDIKHVGFDENRVLVTLCEGIRPN